jgi:hypothetical protein
MKNIRKFYRKKKMEIPKSKSKRFHYQDLLDFKNSHEKFN